MVEEKLEESAIQRDVDHLGEPIGELALGTDVDQFKVITLNEPTKVMLPTEEMHGTLCHAHILRDGDAGFAVNEYRCRPIDVDTELAEERSDVHVRFT